MANFTSIFKRLGGSRFCSNRDGSVIMIVGLMLFLIIGVLMVTVDLSRVQSGATNNQAAIDAAALGAAEYAARYRIEHNTKTGAPSDINDHTKKILLQNLANDQSDATLANGTTDFNVEITTDTLTVTACLNIKTSFASILGQGEVKKVCNTSKSSLPSIKNIEIVFALDASKSMLDKYPDASGTQKLSELTRSMNEIMTFYSSSTNIYWGVVPYTGHVDLGNLAPNIVASDLNTGLPSSELAPATYTNFGKTEDAKYQFDAFEETYSYQDSGARFYDLNNGPGIQGSGLDMLLRVPLTTKLGGNTVFDDARPVGNNMLQAYWHHPYDYFIQFTKTSTANWNVEPAGNGAVFANGTCGECITHVENPVVKEDVCYTPEDSPCLSPNPPPTCFGEAAE